MTWYRSRPRRASGMARTTAERLRDDGETTRATRRRWRLETVDWALLAVVIVAVAVTITMAILDPP